MAVPVLFFLEGQFGALHSVGAGLGYIHSIALRKWPCSDSVHNIDDSHSIMGVILFEFLLEMNTSAVGEK